MEKIFPQDQVWAAAVAAQRANGEYIKRINSNAKEASYFFAKGFSFDKPKNQSLKNDSKLTNVSLMKAFLNSDKSDLTLEDFKHGQEIRGYFCSLMSLLFTGEAREYIKMAVAAAALQEISLTGKELPLIASMPDAYQKNMDREKARAELALLEAKSVPLPLSKQQLFGYGYDQLGFNIQIVDCKYNKKFFNTPYAINAVVANNDGSNSLVYFFDYNKWEVGKTYNVHGNIKRVNGQTTQLEYVIDDERKNN